MPSHLQACLQQARVDPALITAALGDVARARGMVQLAREAGLTREGPYKALPKNGARHRPMDLRFHRRQLHCHRAGGLHPGLPAQADPPVRAAGPSARRGREGPPGSRPNSLRQWTARSDERHGGSFGSEDAGVRVVRIARGLSADNSWRACPAQRSIETMT